ncbi:hypothetical protein GCM10017044_21660 [Kordiimonas sediminis]|uniref:Uncharacterized protein n=1 Tax=Kordiimonas sediminis TaxID=1735581 RepID=A0A919AUK1_9PROT|nr:hypothetical protein [Kordiimonas sediminis]GHF26385.1 hypothetical protein GCM10017044_21660 [Kordiimonas sediminis]
MKKFAICLLFMTAPANADEYGYIRTGEVTVGFKTMLGFGMSLKKVDKWCKGDECGGFGKFWQDVDDYVARDGRCFIKYNDGMLTRAFKPDFYLGNEKVTGNPTHITFQCRRVQRKR